MTRVGEVSKKSSVRTQLRQMEEADGVGHVQTVLQVFAGMKGVAVYRRELLFAMMSALHAVAVEGEANLEAAAWNVRNRLRQSGRRLPRCAMGTTLLVKGLEFDHVLVLDADSYDAKNLYVAMTRATRSLTIVSESETLYYRQGQRTVHSKGRASRKMASG
jgi:superfamily I DNA/RNA helicase